MPHTFAAALEGPRRSTGTQVASDAGPAEWTLARKVSFQVDANSPVLTYTDGLTFVDVDVAVSALPSFVAMALVGDRDIGTGPVFARVRIEITFICVLVAGRSSPS